MLPDFPERPPSVRNQIGSLSAVSSYTALLFCVLVLMVFCVSGSLLSVHIEEDAIMVLV